MHQIFSFKRYIWLIKRQLVENAATYKWGIGILIALTVVLLGLFSDWKTGAHPHLGHAEVFVLLGSGFLFIYSGSFFESIGSKYKGMFYFSLPVTSLERTVTAFTFVVILFPALFLSIFFIFDCVAVQLYNLVHHTSEEMLCINILSDTPKNPSLFSWSSIYTYITFISLFALGSLMFGKNGTIKTGLALFVICLVYVGLMALIYKIILPSDIKMNNFSVNIGGTMVHPTNIFSLILYLIAPLSWIVLYFKLKEKEV